MKYVTYVALTGEIKAWGDCDVPIPLDGTSVLDGAGAPQTHYVANAALVAYTPSQAAAKALRPSYDAAWDNTAMAWQDLRPLEMAQSQQLDLLSAAYAAAIALPVPLTTAAGVAQTYQADPQSIYNATASMLGCQAALATPAGFFWVAADNTHVPFTYHDLQALSAAFFAQGSAAFAKLQTLKAQVRAASSAAATVAVVWT